MITPSIPLQQLLTPQLTSPSHHKKPFKVYIQFLKYLLFEPRYTSQNEDTKKAFLTAI